MISTSRLFVCSTILLFLSLAQALPLPLMTADDSRIYALSKDNYESLYQVVQGIKGRDHYLHLSGAHPHLEAGALQHAHLAGNGPFFSELTPEAMYVSTQPDLEQRAIQHALIPGNGPISFNRKGSTFFVSTRALNTSLLGQRWNLAQRDIDQNNLLTEQQLAMYEAIEQARTPRRDLALYMALYMVLYRAM
ncbi:uncharacterized protein UDID_19239 [Ustilago sp. UG-2017a]|nr:uncharacterized protein UDID_19239 [Ustilago sp. UG-2017a]